MALTLAEGKLAISAQLSWQVLSTLAEGEVFAMQSNRGGTHERLMRHSEAKVVVGPACKVASCSATKRSLGLLMSGHQMGTSCSPVLPPDRGEMGYVVGSSAAPWSSGKTWAL